MIRKQHLLPIVILPVLASASCTAEPAAPAETAGMPNPASVYCEENGGVLELRTDETGAVAGICVFPDGSECDEWAYFRSTCLPGDSLAAPAEASASEGWALYQDAETGLRFEYPADASLVPNDNPLGGLTVLGPVVDGEQWPTFYVSHPADREEYRPPEGADLAQWLSDHMLLANERLADVQIAGVPAIHTRFERSQQSYAFDSYFFAQSEQLYNIVILHTGDREDWTVYNYFLDSIQFDQ
ncbi:MAG: DUF333 domain-containing protein [Anaerolineales bacterium]|nr:DUF333 domain-containing protein [Anaerolineales bacterium]